MPVWTAHTVNERGVEGDLLGIYTLGISAHMAADRMGWYGGAGDVRERQVIYVSDHDAYYLLDRDLVEPIQLDGDLAEVKERARETALAKLNDADKQALGL